jgi:PIN domain nuclease of toxin-antitoxin system
LLLDTHIWIWWLTGDGSLSEAERNALDAEAELRPPRISAITLWEAQMLHERGRLKLTAPFETWLLEATAPGVVEILPLATFVILEVNRLPPAFHGDPADRIIVATARAFEIALATHDRKIRRSRLVPLWKPASQS